MFWREPLFNEDLLWGLDFEASSYCNAKCPLCVRHVDGSPILNPHLQQVNITLQNIKDWFPLEVVKKVGKLSFCGNYGDPCMTPELINIINYFKNYGPAPTVIRTNGGPRNVQFWKEIGKICDTTVFSVDGLKDTNHLYRIGVNWDKVVRNMRACVESANEFGNKVEWEFLIFKHNAHQVEEAKQLCIDLGIHTIQFKRPVGMDHHNSKEHPSFIVRDKTGVPKYTLDLSEEHYLEGYSPVLKNIEDVGKVDIKKTYEYLKNNKKEELDFNNYKELEDCNINCKMNKTSGEQRVVDMFIAATGDLLPCCFIATDYQNPHSETYKQLQKYLPIEKVSLHNNKFENILELFDNNISSNWNSKHEEGKLIKCSQICGTFNTLNKSFYNKERVSF